ncbi:MAG TPA: UDP-3-O-acyl-N-acetylglucosamine deacetylase [bacterium]|nr:UDP-3-O-acyl-N-acetylglucosamine deacetylase [bacterium]
MQARRQGTIAVPVRLEGIGLHTGEFRRMTLRPAPPDTGVVFRRSGGEAVPATLAAVSGTSGCIALGGERGVQTVEHLLSAAWALGVDNLQVDLDGREVPGLDGSALPIVRALAEAGREPQAAARPILEIREPVWVGAGGAWVVALPAPQFGVACLVTLEAPRSEEQGATFDPARDRYEEVIAPARTWGYERDADALHRRGLALGASLQNTLVIGGDGFLNPPRFPNEAARHKVLDLLGDLALVGSEIRGYVIAVRAGHGLHVALAKALRGREG